MTIEYLDAKRLVGLESDRATTGASTPLWTWDNSSTNWGTNSNYSFSNSRINYSFKRDGSSDIAYYDFGTTLSSSKFLLRMKLTVTAESNASGSNVIGFIGLSDSHNSSSHTAQDFLGFFKAGNSNNGIVVKDNSTLAQTNSNEERHTSGTKYYEIKRTSSTNVNFTVYNNSDYSGVFDSFSITISSSLTGLQYFTIKNFASGSGSGTCEGRIEDIVLYNNTDGLTTETFILPTNVQTNSVFISKDGAKRYFFDGSNWNVET